MTTLPSVAWFRRRRRLEERDSQALLNAAIDALFRGDPSAGAGGWTDPAQAAGVPAVFRAVDLLASAVASFAPVAVRAGAPVAEQPTVLRAPDPFTTRYQWLYGAVTSLLMGRQAVWRRVGLDPYGHPSSLILLDPLEVQVAWDMARVHREYRWRGELLVPGRDITVVPYMEVPGQAGPVGPLDALAHVTAGQLAADRLAAAYFADAATPSGVLRSPTLLSAANAEQQRDQWEASHRGRRRTAVLSGGMEYTPLEPMNGRDAQWLETRAWGAQEVARAFGIPPHFLNTQAAGASLTYTNVTQARIELLAFAVAPLLARLEAALAGELPYGQAVRFDTSEWLRADSAQRVDSYSTALAGAAWLTPEEVRAVETREGGLLASLAPTETVTNLPTPRPELPIERPVP